MRAEHQHRAAPLAQPPAALDRRVVDDDAALPLRVVEIEVPDAVELHVFRADPREIVPHAGQHPLDLGRRFFGIGDRELRLRGPMPAQQPRADPPHQPGGDIGAPSQADMPKHGEGADDEPAGGRLQVMQPMTAGLDAQFRIGLNEARLQLMDERQVG